jgi:5-methylcytosine-specific restriction enzyme A
MPMRPARACRNRAVGCPNKTTTSAGWCSECVARVEQQRTRREPWRAWYHHYEWKTLSARVRREEPLCRVCEANGRVEPTTQVDHIVAHRGNWELFKDRANLQGLCDSHHSAKTAREVGLGR